MLVTDIGEGRCCARSRTSSEADEILQVLFRFAKALVLSILLEKKTLNAFSNLIG